MPNSASSAQHVELNMLYIIYHPDEVARERERKPRSGVWRQYRARVRTKAEKRRAQIVFWHHEVSTPGASHSVL